MSVLQANCPSCGAQIEFKSGSTIVIVCPFCRSAVARTDRALEDLGKVAEIVETQSPLKVGLRGNYLNQPFELTGRAQLGHEAGGIWDEWYATFANGWVGWLAEAQGKFYFTFYQPMPPNTEIPAFASLQLGAKFPVQLGNSAFVVAEKGTATARGAVGEIPYKLFPDEKTYYADLSGADNNFATVDYGTNPPFVFVGKGVTLAEIGLQDAKPAEREARKVSAAAQNCPHCGSPVELRAPDASQRVVCPSCDSLLDVHSEGLKYLQTLSKPANEPDFALPIGAVSQFRDQEPLQIIGATVRSITIDGVKYFWHEYLLYTAKIGFRWLVQSDNHWNFVEPVNIGDVAETSSAAVKGAKATYKGKTFKIFQDAPAEVEYVKGEFYWRVEVGEKVWATDYVNAPLMLSKEVSTENARSGNQTVTVKTGEINWSLGKYLTVQEVEKAFNINGLPRPSNVAPNQPFKSAYLYQYGFAFLGLLLIVGIFMMFANGLGRKIGTYNFNLPPLANAQASATTFSEPFDLKSNQNVKIAATAPVDNSWLHLDVDLVNENNDEIESVPIDIEYYQGTEDGEAWTEGSRENAETVSSVPAGKYMIRVDGSWQNFQQPMPVTVTVEQGTTRGINFCFAFFVLLIPTIIGLIRHGVFESRRWSESSFGKSNEGED